MYKIIFLILFGVSTRAQANQFIDLTKAVFSGVFTNISNPIQRELGVFEVFLTTENGVMLRDEYLENTPGFLKQTCSAGIVRVSMDRHSNTYSVFGAEHCIKNWKEGHTFDLHLNAQSTDYVFSKYSSKRKIKVDVSTIGRQWGTDIIFFPIEKDKLTDSLALTLSETDPYPGQSVYFLGFPGGTGPQKVPCTVEGPTMSVLHRKMFALAMRAKCPYIGQVSGASGSPILNKNNELIGVLSAANTKEKDYSYIYFYKFSRQNLDENNFLLKNIKGMTGNYFFSDAVDSFTGEPIELEVENNSLGYLKKMKATYLGQSKIMIGNFQSGIPHGLFQVYKESKLVEEVVFQEGNLVRE